MTDNAAINDAITTAAEQAGVDRATLLARMPYLDAAKFVDDTDQVDAAKVTEFVNTLTPPPRRGPSATGAGRRLHSVAGARSRGVEAAREEARRRYGGKDAS